MYDGSEQGRHGDSRSNNCGVGSWIETAANQTMLYRICASPYESYEYAICGTYLRDDNSICHHQVRRTTSSGYRRGASNSTRALHFTKRRQVSQYEYEYSWDFCMYRVCRSIPNAYILLVYVRV